VRDDTSSNGQQRRHVSRPQIGDVRETSASCGPSRHGAKPWNSSSCAVSSARLANERTGK
jgi:hypothetical protein